MFLNLHCLFTALLIGGSCFILPLNFSIASLTFSIGSSLWMCMTQTYSFPAVRRLWTTLVPFPEATGRQPVTFGSRVPEWPDLSTPSICLTYADTWWLLGPEGLSTFTIPYWRSSLTGLFSGRQPYFSEVSEGLFTRTCRFVLSNGRSRELSLVS